MGPVETATHTRLDKVYKLARMMDERGYGLWVRPNYREKTQTEGFEIAFYRYIRKNAPTNAVLIEIEKQTPVIDLQNNKIKVPIKFGCRIPARVAFRSIHAALDLTVGALLKRVNNAAYTQYYGYSRTQLETFLQILDMPHHREILTQPRKLR